MCDFFSKSYNSIFVISIVIIIAVWLIISVMSWDWRLIRLNKIGLKDDFLFQKGFLKSNLWRTVSMFWMISEYLFTIIPFTAAVIVINLETQQNDSTINNGILSYSIISLAIIIFSFAINPRRHMRCYRKAYIRIDHVLDNYIDTFQNGNDEEKKQAKDLLANAISEGEKDINSSYDID